MITLESYAEGLKDLLAQVERGNQTEFARGYVEGLKFALFGARLLEDSK